MSPPAGVVGNIGVPWNVLTPILQILIAGRLKFVLMRGTRFRGRTARPNSLRLETGLTEDDVALAGPNDPCKSLLTIHLTSACHPSGCSGR